MTTTAQIAANRRNSKRSTGPRTHEGKERSRRNALRHGLAARTLAVAPWEDAAEFRDFAADLAADLAPEGAVETALAQRVALCLWRLERAARIEAELLMGEGALVAAESGTVAQGGAWPAEMATLSRYEATLDRGLERATKLLRERQKQRLSGALPEDEADAAERSQFVTLAPVAEIPPAPLAAERSQFPGDDAAEAAEIDAEIAAEEAEEEEEELSPVELIARREAERLERARLINEACRPKRATA